MEELKKTNYDNFHKFVSAYENLHKFFNIGYEIARNIY
jgi:hypothetical protein